MKFEETARRLRNAMESAGLTQRELAVSSNVSEVSISQYINGNHTPGNQTAKKLSKILNVSPMWLMGFDVSKEVQSGSALSNIDTDIQVEIMSDPELNAHVEKLAKLTASKQIIYDMIDMYYEKENGQ